jgi:AraC-like DNA-binding protein
MSRGGFRNLESASLSLAAGFADQAHMPREVRRLAGITPTVDGRNVQDPAVGGRFNSGMKQPAFSTQPQAFES